MLQILAIATGGAVGAVLRFSMSNGVYRILGRDFPYGTMTVNVLGSFIMGILFTLMIDRLVEDGEPMKAILNIVLSVVLCLSATWLGLSLGRQL